MARDCPERSTRTVRIGEAEPDGPGGALPSKVAPRKQMKACSGSVNPQSEVIAGADAVLLVGAIAVTKLGAGAVTRADLLGRLLGPAGCCASGRAVRGETRGGHEHGADNAGGDCGCYACIPAHDVLVTPDDEVTGCDLVPPKLVPASAKRLKRVCRRCGDAASPDRMPRGG